MILDTDRLITVANFARLRGVSPAAVYNWINNGSERRVVIDGVNFVFAEIEDSKKYKKLKKDED